VNTGDNRIQIERDNPVVILPSYLLRCVPQALLELRMARDPLGCNSDPPVAGFDACVRFTRHDIVNARMVHKGCY
jgi:hypothetical protein